MLVGAVAVVAACGGGSHSGTRQIMGPGYRFNAPAGWSVVRSARAVRVSQTEHGAALVGVTRFPLLHAFRPGLWKKVAGELDGASDAIARRQQGSVTHAQDFTISGEHARRYRIRYDLRGRKLVEELAFVLRGKTEYLLLCRYEEGASHDACDALMSSFRLT